MSKPANKAKAVKAVNPVVALAKTIVDKIKANLIVMGEERAITGEGISGKEFTSTNLKKPLKVSVSMTETEGNKHPSYKISYNDGKFNRVFSGAQARRAYKVLTHVAVDKSIPSEEIDAIAGVLDGLK